MGSTPVVTKLTGSEATWARESRRLARMGRDIRAERSSGLISTMSPAILTPEDIRVHLTARRSLHYSGSEYSHEVSTLTAICDYCDNPAVRICLKKYPLLRPVSRHVRLDSLSAEDYDKLLDFLLRDGLAGAKLRSAAAVAVSLGCGLRTQELQYAVRADLGADWVLKVEHVKGRGTYGEPRSVIVPPLFRPLLVRYFERPCGPALISSVSGGLAISAATRCVRFTRSNSWR
mgnify:FL=1